MTRHQRAAGFPARLFTLARDTFEASVAVHYRAPWNHGDRHYTATAQRNAA